MEKMQTLSPVGNDSPGAITYPLDATTVLLCGATETAPACTKTTVTVAGEGTYVVKANGTVQFTPETTYSGTATMWSETLNNSDTVSLLVEFGKGLREGEAQANADAIYTVVKEFFPS